MSQVFYKLASFLTWAWSELQAETNGNALGTLLFLAACMILAIMVIRVAHSLPEESPRFEGKGRKNDPVLAPGSVRMHRKLKNWR